MSHVDIHTIAKQLKSTIQLDGVDTMLIAGSGIMEAMLQEEFLQRIPYSAIRGMPTTSVVGHVPELSLLELNIDSTCRRVIVFGGRFHLYEGHDIYTTTLPIQIAAHLGISNCILTNAAGGLNPKFRVGEIMLIDDILNMSGKRDLPTVSQRVVGSRERENLWRDSIDDALGRDGVAHWRGTYVSVSGPSYETRAEVRMYRMMADAIGMSTVHEWNAARMLGMTVCGCSMITNTLSDSSIQKLSHDEVVEAAHVARHKIAMFVRAALLTVTNEN